MKISQSKSTLSSNAKGIRSLILATGLPLNKAPEALGMSSSRFMAWWNSKIDATASNSELNRLAQYLGISEEQIISGAYDLNLLRSRIFHDPLTLPERYSINQFSYLRTSAHIFRYLVLTRGQHFADRIANKLNVSPLLYQNHDNKISLNYFLDLLDIIESSGFSQSEMDTLPGVLFLGLAESPLFNEFKKSKNYFECYETLAKNLNLFDANFIYKSDVDSCYYRMTTFLAYESHHHFRWTESQMNRLHRYRQLLVGWFPYLCGLPPVIPKVTHRVLPDGIETVCLVEFPKAGFIPLLIC